MKARHWAGPGAVALAFAAVSAHVAGAPSLAMQGEGTEFDGEFEVVGLPALSTDGYVAWAHALSDGARGNPNLVFDVRRAADGAPVWQLVVLGPDEYDDEAFDNVSGRLDAVRAFLAQHEWTPLDSVALTHQDEPGSARWMARADLGGERPLHLLVSRSRVVLGAAAGGPARVVVPRWRALEVPDDDRECGGANRPSLGRLWVSPDHTTLLLRVDYTGTDMCWEPEPLYEVWSVDALAPTGADACGQRGGECMEGCEPGYRGIGGHDCVDSTCCLANAVPVLCERVPTASCQPGCDRTGMTEVANAFCPDDAVCCESAG